MPLSFFAVGGGLIYLMYIDIVLACLYTMYMYGACKRPEAGVRSPGTDWSLVTESGSSATTGNVLNCCVMSLV